MSFLKSIVLTLLTVAVLASCDHKVSMVTNVHADGSLERTIVQRVDSKDHGPVFDIGTEKGWTVKEPSQYSTENDTSKAAGTIFQKRFASVAEANADLGMPIDTLLRVTSTFEKKFQWFYTHLYYADTYHSLNRMPLPIAGYLTVEDHAFIERLPAEGKPMAKADSLYLDQLEHKLFDIYGITALFGVYYSNAEKLLQDNGLAPAWLDTLRAHKKEMLNYARSTNDLHDNYMIERMNSLGIPLPDDAESQFEIMLKPFSRVLNFITTAHSGTYQHAIHMPWDVVRTNADSVSGRTLFWRPPSMKFLVKDYTMYAEARQMNGLPIALSVMAIGFTVYLLLRRRGARAL